MAVPDVPTRRALVASLIAASSSGAIDTLLATVSVPTDTTNSRQVIGDLIAYAADRRREDNRGTPDIINKNVF